MSLNHLKDKSLEQNHAEKSRLMRHQMYIEKDLLFDCNNMFFESRNDLIKKFSEAGVIRSEPSNDEEFSPLDIANLDI